MKPEERFIRKVMKNTGETIFQYSLFQGGEQVLVGLSGGKDSLSLLDLLSAWNSRSPVKVELYAAHIEMDGFGHKIDRVALEDFCRMHKVPFHHRRVSVDLERDRGKDKCFLCSWYRRKALFDLAYELKCSKLALGHHLDDIVTTLLMNMSHKGIFATMAVKLPLFQGALTLVRPLGKLEEKDIVRYAELRRLAVQHQDCPFGKDQSRETMKGILGDLTRMAPQAKKNLFRSMSRIRSEYLS
jgi:tRNA 2-thiocytidine biosynthesis protein TtcA